MRIFDFLKKKELEKIKKMELQIEKMNPILVIENDLQKKQKEVEKLEFKKEQILKNQEKQLSEALKANEVNLNNLISEKFIEVKNKQKELKLLEKEYQHYASINTALQNQIKANEVSLDVLQFGVYEPFYNFEKSDTYKIELQAVLESQRALIRDEKAVICSVNWSVDGSLTKGKANSKSYMKLVLRAFNSECNALIAKVNWNSIEQTKERIHKSFDAINKVAEHSAVQIQKEYLDLKLQELFLEYEFQLKVQKEKEETKKQFLKQKEVERVQREFETAVNLITNYENQIEEAKLNLNTASGISLVKWQKKIKTIELKAKEARISKEKAELLFKNTDVGYVYMASNIGSFGENIYKIGITKSLDPIAYVKELGATAVPFPFDVHGFIFSEEATHLEQQLHTAFFNNKVNLRNENTSFFRLTWEAIEQKVNELGYQITLLKNPEAKEFRETKMLHKKSNNEQIIISPSEVVFGSSKKIKKQLT